MNRTARTTPHRQFTDPKKTKEKEVAIANWEDGSEQNDIKQRLRHSELRLKQAQSLAHIGSWEFDLATGIVDWSDEACRIYGLSPEDHLQTYNSWLSFIHPDDHAYVCKISEDSLKKFRNFSFQHRILRKDGVVKYILSKGQFEFDEEGSAIYLNGIAHDITETKKAEQSLQQAEANLRTIIDLIPQSIFAKDESGKFSFVNKSFAALYGLSPESIIGSYQEDIIPEKAHSQELLLQDKNVIDSNTVQVIPEQVFVDSEGNTRVFHTTKVPYAAAGTNKKMVLGVANDVTAQKSMESERTQLISDIVARNKNLEKFTYIISHNLRIPVANILGVSEILQMPTLDKEEKEDFIGKLAICADQLDAVVIDLNEVLQVDRKEFKHKTWLKFSDVLDDVELSFDDLIKKEGIKIVRDFTAIDDFYSIKNYMHSIFFNLISNSLKFSRPGVPPAIEITSVKRDGQVQLIFKDNGLGIDLDNKSNHVFGLYKRFHSHVDGKGMGLFMTKTQVESLGGKISISSEVDKGTEFKIQLDNAEQR